MASYTMELREYIEMWSQDNDTMNTRDRIEAGRVKLFDFDYPIFDTDYKKIFETHFIRRFYFREIGSETEGKFKFDLETWFVINMPFFNKLFQSELITFDPLTNIKSDTTLHKTNDKAQTNTSQTDGTSNATSDGTASETGNTTTNQTEHQDTTGSNTENDFSRNVEADTPDTRLNLTTNDGSGVLEYASNIKEDTGKKTNTSSGSNDVTNDTITDKTASNTTHATTDETTSVTSSGNRTMNEIVDYLESKTGKIGTKTFASMLNEYRDSFIRIENQIFKEIEKEGLFMLVY